MQLHIVGGFLGSGKTTAIANAAKDLMAQGQRVGVVTNDQGKYLVDTTFVRLADVPAVEITGGCFCCNYGDLTAQLDALQTSVQPHVIFAESVGSCADIVATVVRPLRELSATVQPTSFSVFADSRLLRRWLMGHPLPFSANIVYLFGQQIAEAGLLVINKADLLTPEQLSETEQLAKQRFPDKPLYSQNSLDMPSIQGWLAHLSAASLPSHTLSLDYQRYGQAEAEMAWLDMHFALDTAGSETVINWLAGLRQELREVSIGHFKALIGNDTRSVKVSFVTLDDPTASTTPSTLPEGRVQIGLNIRAQTDADTLRRIAEQSLSGLTIHELSISAFHPGWPTPTHRLLD